MNWRALLAVAVSVGLALGFVPVLAQAASGSSGVASVSLSHVYTVTNYGFGTLNDTFAFSNNGTSSVQIPTLQVGLPENITSLAVGGLVLKPSDQYSLSQSTSNGTTMVTITPDSATLNAGANASVVLEAFLNNIISYPSAGFLTWAPTLVLLSPSLNVNVTKMSASIVLPSGGTLNPTPAGFATPTTSGATPSYTMNATATQPKLSDGDLNFSDSSTSAFTPIAVGSLVRTIVPSANGLPMVNDQFTVQDLAAYDISQVQFHFLHPGLTSVTLLPNTEPPLVNPQTVIVSNGLLAFPSTSLGANLLTKSNITLIVAYPVPSSAMAISGGSVKITVPLAPFITAPVSNYTIQLASAKGVVPIGSASVKDSSVTPLTTGSVVLSYSVSVGWAADQAIPAGILLFTVAFAMFAIQRPSTLRDEAKGKESLETADVLRAFDDKTGLETQYLMKLSTAAKGSISRADFERMRNEVTDLRGRATQRLAELKRDLGSGKQFDLLTRVGEAEKEEDRAFRDLLNLYVQYHGNRMNEQTFKRLQPSYRRRVDSAINRLSDLLHQVQTEEK